MKLENTSVTTLKGVGPALAGKLARIGIHSLQDILFHLPFRYEDRTRITPVGSLSAGMTAVIEGDIIACNIAFGRRRSLLAYLEDGSGRIALRFFHFSKAQQSNLSGSKSIRCYGEVRKGAAGLEIYHPEYHTAGTEPLSDRLTPVYPSTEGLSQARYRVLVDQVLEQLLQSPLQQLPVSRGDTGINEAIQFVHKPPPGTDLRALEEGTHAAQQLLAFEELVAHQTGLLLMRESVNEIGAPAFSPPGRKCEQLIHSLGFSLTRAQERVTAEINNDLGKTKPALRLIQGDVGSGKTVVAAIAALQAVENGYQVALMAPTEILAEQHFANFVSWLTPLNITTGWLSGKVKGQKRRQELADIASGDAQIIIGTHALFQKDVEFRQLGLVIIDEQHRFGVHQRLAMRDKGLQNNFLPHQLTMTATPIPRTLTMSLYADMDTSIIDELPLAEHR